MPTPFKNLTIHGFHTEYEEKDYEAIRYLRDDLQFDEARVFFDQARGRGQAQFEDNFERQFTISYKDGVYMLTRRAS